MYLKKKERNAIPTSMEINSRRLCDQNKYIRSSYCLSIHAAKEIKRKDFKRRQLSAKALNVERKMLNGIGSTAINVRSNYTNSSYLAKFN